MMADLSESIMREARRIEAEWSRNGRSISTRDTLIDAIARALRARDERAAGIGYRICAETRHVTLGDKVRTAILSAD